MSLTVYNNNYAVLPSGLNNTGCICYFNSLLQCLLSCTSMNQYFINASEKSRNLTWLAYKKLVIQFLTTQNCQNESITFWPIAMAEIKRKFPNYGHGQEDGSEGFTLLIDAFQDSEVDDLFKNRFKTMILCENCENIINKIDEPLMTDIYSLEHKGENLISYIKKNNPITDNDYKCEKCKTKGHSKHIQQLSRIPEVFIILFKKYDQKIKIDFPLQFAVESAITQKDMIYNLVAQMEHSGSQSGGHYWALGMRRDGQIYNFNDSCVSKKEFEPTVETYMAFYHILKS